MAYFVSRFPHLSETFVLNEIHWIRKHGIDVHIFSMRDPEPGPVHEHAEELIDIVHYSPWLSWPVVKANLYFLFRSPLVYLNLLLWIVRTTYRHPRFMAYVLAIYPKSVYFTRLIESLGIGHVHAHFAWAQHIAALVASKLLNLSNSVTVHAFELYAHDPHIVQRQLEASEKVITISEYNRKYIARLCPNINVHDITVIRLGVDMDYFQQAASQPSGEVCQLLSVGSLIEKKGHEYLIQACHILAQRGVKFHCSIVGDGPSRDTLEKLIQDYNLTDCVGWVSGCVNLEGALQQHHVRELYQQSDIFALPCVVAETGDRDGMPTVLIEAMASGLPVVTTPVTGIPELVRHGETGYLVPERDPVALADALQCLIQDEALRNRLGRTAREQVVGVFDIQRNTARLADIFQKAANS